MRKVQRRERSGIEKLYIDSDFGSTNILFVAWVLVAVNGRSKSVISLGGAILTGAMTVA
jgi:hypothetical protein